MTDRNNTITVKEGVATSYVGAEGVDFFRVKSLKMAIKMAKDGMMLTRGMSLTRCLKMATEYTGNKYKRTEADRAIADLDAMLAQRVADGTVTIHIEA